MVRYDDRRQYHRRQVSSDPQEELCRGWLFNHAHLAQGRSVGGCDPLQMTGGCVLQLGPALLEMRGCPCAKSLALCIISTLYRCQKENLYVRTL